MIEDQLSRVDRAWARLPSMLDASRDSLKDVRVGESGGAVEGGIVEL